MEINSPKCYTYAEHRFRFAAWAAGSAVTQIGFSFKVKDAHDILEATGFRGLAEEGVEWLPEPANFDVQHRDWRRSIRREAKQNKIQGLSHGRAAKLINVFLKALMPPDLENLPAGHKEKWCTVHPPIDRILLANMKKDGVGCPDFWSSLPGSSFPAWTQFGSEDYQKVIDLIRENEESCLGLGSNGPVPLWKVERYWDGHQ